jgi:acyl transferase domain-containing protein
MSERASRRGELSTDQQALLALRKMKARLVEIERARTEPIAVIGLGCRFPGGADDPQAFWRLLHDGVDAVREVPRDRWDIDAFYDPDPDAPGKMSTRYGAFLDEVAAFDAQFFGISPREAVSMDPQQRLLLEVSWEALEDAGLAADRLAGSLTGVFVGLSTNDYGVKLLRANDPTRLDAYFGTGNAPSAAAGRLSYVLGLEGPCLALDTACSSSLVAVHLACHSLRQGECDTALAGGANVILTPDITINFSRARMMAPDGRCKTFDAAADGYVRGEGCGVVVLKRLSDALAHGDRVRAVIRGSAVNQDGRSGGFTAPSERAQETVIRKALAAAGVAPAALSYVEAHGTGTALGDPIEAQALATVLRPERGKDRPLVLGSVKTNVGHLEAAAGIAGLIKVVLALEHGEIPPHLHFKRWNPHVVLDGFPAVIPTACLPWPPAEGRRIAGVSSFGFSGTNAHVVVEEAPAPAAATGEADPPLHLLALSAGTEPALAALAGRFERHLALEPSASLADLCYTAGTGRSHFNHRVAVIATSTEEARVALRAVAAGEEHAAAARGKAPATPPPVAFLFTGQGAQYLGMGRRLYNTHPSFRRTVDECAALLRPHLEQPLLSVMESENATGALIDQTAYAQPALFVLEYALARLWQEWGVQPALVLGHSVGEYVAACVAGVFSLEDALSLVAARGRLMQALPPGGAMASVMADAERVAAAIAAHRPQLSIAAVNGPSGTVISGAAAALDAVVGRLESEGVRTRRLNVSHAFHSPLLEPMLDEFERRAAAVAFRAPQIGLVSNLTGAVASDADVRSASYWRRQAREPVQFATGMATLRERGCRVFLEVGPHPVLAGMAGACLPGAMRLLPSLRRGRDDWRQMLETLRDLYLIGVPVDWAGVHRDHRRRKVGLPTYPFQRERFWADLPEPAAGRAPAASASAVPGRAATDNLYEVAWPEKPRAAGSSERTPGTWLVLADQGGFGRRVARRLEEKGERVVVVRRGRAYERADDGSLRIVAGEPEHYRRLWRDATDGLPIKTVLHLWGLDEPAGELELETLRAAQAVGCESAVHMAQAALDAASDARLWLITRGAQPVQANDAVRIAHAPLWGLGRVLPLEHPGLWGGLVDLDPEGGPDEDALILDHVAAADGEDQIAFRGGRRHVARLVRIRGEEAGGARIDPEGAYLVTGGLGGLGVELAAWLVRGGARHLVLTGRTGLPARAEWDALPDDSAAARQAAAVRALEARGAEVRVVRADAADAERMTALFAELKAAPARLRGIFHAAGLMEQCALRELTGRALHEVLRPKVLGAWLLHELSRDLELDHFVLFSSAAAVWGSIGLAHYAAANAFLDALAEHRKAQGRPALSVAWGPWSTGMGTSAAQQWLAQMGVVAFSPEKGLGVLEGLLGGARARVTAASVDWSVFRPVYEAKTRRLLLEGLEPEVRTGAPAPEAGRALRRLREALPADRPDALSSYLRGELARVLGFGPGRPLDPERGFFELGMDSLLAVELRNRLQTGLDHALPPTLAFDHPSLQTLARYLGREVLGLGAEAVRETAAPYAASSDELLMRIEGLADDEVELMVAARSAPGGTEP